MSPNSSTLASCPIPDWRNQLTHGHQQCLSNSCPCTALKPSTPSCPDCLWPFPLTCACTKCLRSVSRRGKAWAMHILHILTEFQKQRKGRAHHCHCCQQPSPGGKLCIPLQISQWCSRRESPIQDKAEQQQLPLPILLQALGIYTAGTRVNPWSLMRTDPMLLSSLLAICTLNSCLRRPNVLQHCCCVGCLLWLPFLAKVQPRCRCHHPAQMCRAHSSQLASNRAIYAFLENIIKKSCQSWMRIISN